MIVNGEVITPSTFFLKVQVTFEGVRGNSYRGDIAIDDVSVRPGSCSGTPPTPPPPQTPAPPVGSKFLFIDSVHLLAQQVYHLP